MFYWKLALMSLKSQMQYKSSLFLSTFGQFITAFTFFFGINFILDKVEVIDGFTYGQVLICFSVVMMSFALGELFGGRFTGFSELLGNGEFDRALVRPRNIIMQVMLSKLDFTRLGLIVQAVVVLAYAVPASGITWTFDKVMTLCLMIICGSIIFFGLFLMQATFALFTIQDLSFFNVFTYGARKFGQYPFSIYGKGILRVLTFVIPLALFQYYPLLYLIEKEQSVWYMLMPVISHLFMLPCYAFFRFGISKYKSTGS